MMKKIYVKEMVNYLQSQRVEIQVKGDQELWIDGYSSLNSLTKRKVSWIKYWEEEFVKKLKGKRETVIVGRFLDAREPEEKNCYILCEDPKMCFFKILNEFFVEKSVNRISDSAVIYRANIGKNCSVGEFSVLGKEVILGDNVIIGNHVMIQGKVTVGDNCVIKSGAVIGNPGFGYYRNQAGHMEKVPHLGGVTIGNYVEIGANTCIDCGTMDDTVIGDYCKIDNLCHIGHNVHIGKDVIIVAGSVVCGSCVIEDKSYLAPGAVIKNQTQIGENSFIGMQSAVIKDVIPNSSVFGVPTRPFKRNYVI